MPKGASSRYFAAEEHLFDRACSTRQIDRPIEAFTGFDDNTPVTSFANAPEATLLRRRARTAKYIPLDGLSSGGFFGSRRAVVIGNYTYTDSKFTVGPNDTVSVYGTTTAGEQFLPRWQPAHRSVDHLANLQLGLEQTRPVV